MLLGGGGNPSAWNEVDGVRGATMAAARIRPWRRSHRATTTSGASLETTLSEPAELWWAPIETISNSEAGFERVYQGPASCCRGRCPLAPGAARTVTVSHVVATSADHAERRTRGGSDAGVA